MQHAEVGDFVQASHAGVTTAWQLQIAHAACPTCSHVQVHYTGTLEDGSVFDSSLERDPLEFEIGGGKVIPGFDDAVLGLAEGEKHKQLVPAERAYGKHLCMIAGVIPKCMHCIRADTLSLHYGMHECCSSVVALAWQQPGLRCFEAEGLLHTT